ncbi:MAG: hypothetical protein M3N51_03225 [Actinomycetota bacterium]|nr:hypothetical protein [Actinomycetota bacterium]
MHARVTTVQGTPDSVDEAVGVVQGVIAQARQIPGFKGVLSLVNRETGKGITATLWESEEAMRASEEAADSLRGQAVSAVEGSNLVSVERYEVAIDERGS